MQFIIGYVHSCKRNVCPCDRSPKPHQTTYIYDGRLYRGVAINEFIVIKKGYHDIIGKIEGEEIIEKKNFDNSQPNHEKFDRFVDIKIIGYISENKFKSGIKYLPMIQDELHLISTNSFPQYILSKENRCQNNTIGKSLLEEIPIHIPINGIFNYT
jgi:hypothetical protein